MTNTGSPSRRPTSRGSPPRSGWSSSTTAGRRPTLTPPELHAAGDSLADVYGGVRDATATDSRGRSRKLVREYAGRDDLDRDEVGHVLRVLEAHDLVVQDGNRWRVPEEE